MSAKGGYIIVDFKNLPLTSGEPSAIEGIAAKIINPYSKATLISGLVVSDESFPDFFAPFEMGENNMAAVVEIGGKTITISVDIDDNVIVTVS